jgi:pimeloyl-ACP methyl ester carboxylesterase
LSILSAAGVVMAAVVIVSPLQVPVQPIRRGVGPNIRIMTTFALVHGGWLGAWCWELLTPLLEQAGHDVVAMDLPAEDGMASFENYADVVCASLDGLDEDIVLVGHSYGGNTIPLVAARRPARHLVYLCALVPDVGRSMFDQLQDEPDILNPRWVQGLSEPDEQLRTTWVDLDLARELICADCDDAIAAASVNRLRPQSAYPNTLPFPLAEFPSVSSTYVVCTDDQFVSPQWSKRIARDRLGANLIELPGGHSPLLSQPSAVADVLCGIPDGT